MSEYKSGKEAFVAGAQHANLEKFDPKLNLDAMATDCNTLVEKNLAQQRGPARG